MHEVGRRGVREDRVTCEGYPVRFCGVVDSTRVIRLVVSGSLKSKFGTFVKWDIAGVVSTSIACSVLGALSSMAESGVRGEVGAASVGIVTGVIFSWLGTFRGERIGERVRRSSSGT